MPFINIKLEGQSLTDRQKQELHSRTTDLMSEIMNKKPEVTSVLIEEVPAGNWAIGKKGIAESSLSTAHIDIKVTKGTNTKDEKADMISASISMLKEVVGEIPEATYVIIDEIASDAWGFDGLTMEERQK